MRAPNAVHPDTPDVGDVVRVQFKRGTLSVTVEGQIANVRRMGRVRQYESECGSIIYRTDNVTVVQMIKRYVPLQPGLF